MHSVLIIKEDALILWLDSYFYISFFVMKKLLYIVLFSLLALSGRAQKSYVHIFYTSSSAITVTGDIPPGVENAYYSFNSITMGELLNLLADNGFVLEHMAPPAVYSNSNNTSNQVKMYYVLSRDKSDNASGGTHETPIVDTDNVREVARYNLQGLPVTADEKGVQIVVYSNYTTRTVINE